jgi:hypothetical protein
MLIAIAVVPLAIVFRSILSVSRRFVSPDSRQQRRADRQDEHASEGSREIRGHIQLLECVQTKALPWH